MFRKPSSRKYKNKGLKVRYVLLILLMLAAFLWFIYLWMQSPDGKKVLEERNTNVSEQLQNRQERLKLGRKDLRERGKVSGRNGLNNQSEEEVDDDSKHEENVNETGLNGKDHIDGDRLEERSANVSGQLHDRRQRLKLGRKDLPDRRDVSDRNALNNQTEEDDGEDDNEAAVEDKDENDEDREYEDKDDLMLGEQMLEEIEDEEEDRDKQEENEEKNGNSHEAEDNRDYLRLVKLDRQRGSETNLEKSDVEHNDEDKRIIDNKANDDNHFDELTTDATLASTNSQNTTRLPSNATYETVYENGSKTTDLSGDGVLVTSTMNERENQISNESDLVGAGRVDTHTTAPVEDVTSVTTLNLDHNASANFGKTADNGSLESNIKLRGSMEQPSSMTAEDSRKLMASTTTTEKSKGKLADDKNTTTTVDDKSEEFLTSEVSHQVNEAITDLGSLPETTNMARQSRAKRTHL